MNKNVTIKTMNNEKTVFEIKSTDTLKDFRDNVRNSLSCTQDKIPLFIYKGSYIDDNNFNEIENNSICLCVMAHKQIEETENENVQNDNVQNQNIQKENILVINRFDQESEPALELESESESESEPKLKETQNTKEELYNYEQVKSSMIVFLDLVRSNQQLRYLYMNDPQQLIHEIVYNEDLNIMIKKILQQSQHVVDAIKNKTNIKIALNFNDMNDMNDINHDDRNNNKNNNDITEQDANIIMELIDMGFDPTLVVKTYSECGYDKDATYKKLLG
jgi:hypothetical protein